MNTNIHVYTHVIFRSLYFSIFLSYSWSETQGLDEPLYMYMFMKVKEEISITVHVHVYTSTHMYIIQV